MRVEEKEQRKSASREERVERSAIRGEVRVEKECE